MKKLYTNTNRLALAIALSLASFSAIAAKQEIVDFEYAQNTLANYHNVYAACKALPGFKEQDFYKSARDDLDAYFNLYPASFDEIVWYSMQELRKHKQTPIDNVNVCYTLKDMAQGQVRKSFSTYKYEG